MSGNDTRRPMCRYEHGLVSGSVVLAHAALLFRYNHLGIMTSEQGKSGTTAATRVSTCKPALPIQQFPAMSVLT